MSKGLYFSPLAGPVCPAHAPRWPQEEGWFLRAQTLSRAVWSWPSSCRGKILRAFCGLQAAATVVRPHPWCPGSSARGIPQRENQNREREHTPGGRVIDRALQRAVMCRRASAEHRPPLRDVCAARSEVLLLFGVVLSPEPREGVAVPGLSASPGSAGWRAGSVQPLLRLAAHHVTSRSPGGASPCRDPCLPLPCAETEADHLAQALRSFGTSEKPAQQQGVSAGLGDNP